MGLAILAWPAIPYTERKKAVDIGPIEVETETQKEIALPPVLGVVAAASGVALIALVVAGHSNEQTRNMKAT